MSVRRGFRRKDIPMVITHKGVIHQAKNLISFMEFELINATWRSAYEVVIKKQSAEYAEAHSVTSRGRGGCCDGELNRGFS